MGNLSSLTLRLALRIQICHVVKMSEQSENIEVAEYLGNALKIVKIMNDSILTGTSPIIVNYSAKGSAENGLTELEFFKDFVLEDYKSYIAINY